MSVPDEIRIDAMTRVLTLHWPDGETQRIAHAQLRAVCPCAGCRRARLAGGLTAVDPDVTLSGIEPMGYGVQLSFSDGHARGIYPWPWLRALGGNGPADETRVPPHSPAPLSEGRQ